MEPMILGQDPTRVEHLWQMMYRQHFWHGHGIVRATGGRVGAVADVWMRRRDIRPGLGSPTPGPRLTARPAPA